MIKANNPRSILLLFCTVTMSNDVIWYYTNTVIKHGVSTLITVGTLQNEQKILCLRKGDCFKPPNFYYIMYSFSKMLLCDWLHEKETNMGLWTPLIQKAGAAKTVGLGQTKCRRPKWDLEEQISADADGGPRSRVRTAGHSAQPPIDVSGNLSAHVSA